MLKQHFESMITGIENRILQTPGSPNSRKKFALHIARLGSQLYSGKNRVAWCGIAAPFDLLHAMGITSCFVEFVGALLTNTGAVVPLLEEAEHAGFAADTCGYHRSVIGAARQGLMPSPDFLIATSCPCSGGLATIENLSRHFKKDLFLLQIPQDQSETSVRYLADQIKNMVKFVGDHTGNPLNKDKLRKAIENTNKTRAMMNEIFELAKNVPSPANGTDLGNFGIVLSLLFGTEGATEVARAFRDEFSNRLESGRSGVPNEKVRLLWIQNRIQFKNPLIEQLEEKFGACIVIDELNNITWDPIDPEDPYTGLARRSISIPFNGPIERRIEHLQKLARDYQIDGAINPCHWGCRQGTGARGLIEEGFKKIGIPVLNLEVDCVDPRNFAEGQLKTRLEAFIEMLDHRSSS